MNREPLNFEPGWLHWLFESVILYDTYRFTSGQTKKDLREKSAGYAVPRGREIRGRKTGDRRQEREIRREERGNRRQETGKEEREISKK
ncbi:MAG: hypothetical protein JRF53_10620 [Deltaproteobacteria bacterium]|nr:hypothetical protein [Deltaproteobacteria bacterium]